MQTLQPSHPPGRLIVRSHDSSLTQRWCRICHDVSTDQITEADVCCVFRRSASSIRPPGGHSFQKLAATSHTIPCCHERKPWQQRHISNHDWNRTRSENPTHLGGHPVEFASRRLRL
jgi:hypothetical protein